MMNHEVDERSHNQRVGSIGEEAAVRLMRSKGMTILHQNYRMVFGEIDIVAQDGSVLVFCEVKTRDSDRFGDPECAITPIKQRQMRRSAEGYLMLNRLDEQECRFDVAAVQIDGGEPEITYFENAFFF
jgi:putative endonuclease